ncbi:hypothetical protein [Lysinibacter cavernae]|uniref:Uncharacterized protein n=1 Tax=Lysinibacter cavernae TaxID=1640652 RepID=A0A7X5QZB8_9MICO|nr:hypothetical protein [Lysinibacter cavernae]NIH52550.1 hypothetical protein [Lysinibacter cavernae]
MIAVAQLIRDRPGTVARTLRETFGVGLSDLGDRLSWGEALLLLREAAADQSTALGADLADWAYPASIRDLIALSAQIANPKVASKLMPWAMERPGAKEPNATPDEVVAAVAELDAGIVFGS